MRVSYHIIFTHILPLSIAIILLFTFVSVCFSLLDLSEKSKTKNDSLLLFDGK